MLAQAQSGHAAGDERSGRPRSSSVGVERRDEPKPVMPPIVAVRNIVRPPRR
jgi:hypothetical protein